MQIELLFKINVLFPINALRSIENQWISDNIQSFHNTHYI